MSDDSDAIRQLTHAEHQPDNIPQPFSLLLENFQSPANVGAVFRSADAFGCRCLYLCGTTIVPPNSKLRRLSRAADKYVPWQQHSCAQSLVRSLKAQGVRIASLELTANSTPLPHWQPTNEHWCLILGAEDVGVSAPLLALSDAVVHIPMFGHNSSLNVGSACAVALYQMACK